MLSGIERPNLVPMALAQTANHSQVKRQSKEGFSIDDRQDCVEWREEWRDLVGDSRSFSNFCHRGTLTIFCVPKKAPMQSCSWLLHICKAGGESPVYRVNSRTCRKGVIG
jgi:hypothetical protein